MNQFQYYTWQSSCIISDEAESFMNTVNNLMNYNKVKDYLLKQFPNIESEKFADIEYLKLNKKVHCEYTDERHFILLLYSNKKVDYGYVFRPEE